MGVPLLIQKSKAKPACSFQIPLAIRVRHAPASRGKPLNAEIAKTGGLHKRDYAKSNGVGLADAISAATAEAENAELKTLNTKHCPMFKGLRPAYTKSKTNKILQRTRTSRAVEFHVKCKLEIM